MRFPRNKQIFRGQLDVAAFAGVFFILLIFILMHSRLVFTPGVPIRLPTADDLPGVIGRSVVVSVDAGGQYYFDNQVTPERRLRTRLSEEVAAAREPLTLIIQADEDVSSGRMMDLMTLARKAGVKDVAWAGRPSTPSTNRVPALLNP